MMEDQMPRPQGPAPAGTSLAEENGHRARVEATLVVRAG